MRFTVLVNLQAKKYSDFFCYSPLLKNLIYTPERALKKM